MLRRTQTYAEKIAAKLDERQCATIRDIYGCPGLYAGQYDRIEDVPHNLYVVRYEGFAGMMGLGSKVRLTDTGMDVIDVIGDRA